MDGSDLDLARAAARGDAPAFHALIDRHVRDMFRLALSLSGSRTDAEDICQETWVGAFKGVKRFDGRSSFKTWLTRILLRQAAKSWKRKQRKSWISLESGRTSPHDATEHGRIEPATRARDGDAAMDLMDAINRLGPDHQQVVILREMHGMSYEEIAEAVGIPCGTVESRLYRARVELRKILKDYDV